MPDFAWQEINWYEAISVKYFSIFSYPFAIKDTASVSMVVYSLKLTSQHFPLFEALYMFIRIFVVVDFWTQFPPCLKIQLQIWMNFPVMLIANNLQQKQYKWSLTRVNHPWTQNFLTIWHRLVKPLFLKVGVHLHLLFHLAFLQHKRVHLCFE